MPTEIPSTDLTQLLRTAKSGELAAIDQVVALLHDEPHHLTHSRLRRMPGSTLPDTTALVHGACLRFQRQQPIGFAELGPNTAPVALESVFEGG